MDKLLRVDRQILDEKVSIVVEEVIPRIDGLSRIMLTSKSPLISNSGQVVGILGVSTDITDQRKIQSELERAKEEAESASRIKFAFLVSMNHSIHPLSARILGIIQELVCASNEIDLILENQTALNDQKLLNLIRNLSDKIKNDGIVLTNAVDQLLVSLNKIIALLKCV